MPCSFAMSRNFLRSFCNRADLDLADAFAAQVIFAGQSPLRPEGGRCETVITLCRDAVLASGARG